jgi:hypothetical protein
MTSHLFRTHGINNLPRIRTKIIDYGNCMGGQILVQRRQIIISFSHRVSITVGSEY